MFVLTGAGNGIGREVALKLIGKGVRVAAVDIDEAALRETARLAGDPARISTHVVNITRSR